jgi:hypothetical protein
MPVVTMVRVHARAVLCMALMAWTATIALLYTASTRRTSDPAVTGDGDGAGIDLRPQSAHGQLRTIANEPNFQKVQDPIKLPDDTILVG